jgi:hypothetical protein
MQQSKSRVYPECYPHQKFDWIMVQRQLENTNTKFYFSGTMWKNKNQNQTIDTIWVRERQIFIFSS